jgi:hypothetical protein
LVGRRVDIRSLKEFARTELPRRSALREVILGDRDELTAEEFLVKIDVWLKLARMESS